jgi:type VI secretion system protein ImpA
VINKQNEPMLSQSTLDAFANPISADEPSGPDLGYDPDFTEFETISASKPEQQFGDTIMPGEEPNWGVVAEKAEALLMRSKDYRVAVALTRALTHKHGVQGFVQGVQLLNTLTTEFWDSLHPALDADDDNDPTMRVNALAPLFDYEMLLKDLTAASVGKRTEVGQLKVKDIEAHYSKSPTFADTPDFSIDQVQAAIAELLESDPEAIAAALEALPLIKQFQGAINDKVGSQSSIDLAALQTIGFALQVAVQTVKGVASPSEGESDVSEGGTASGGGSGGGALKSRDDAVRLLSQIITFLEKTEPGNPAPLLIKRAQRLIGMNFIDIINDMAPEALSSVQNIAGRSEES